MNEKTTRRAFLGGAGGVLAAGGIAALGTVVPSSAATAATIRPSSIPAAGAEKIYFIGAAINGPYYVDVRAGLTLADSWFGTTSQVVGPAEVNLQEIVSITEAVIARAGTRGIVLPTFDPVALLPVFNDAAAKKIPVVTYNVDAPATRIGFVGPSEQVLTTKAAELIGQKAGGHGKVAYISQIVSQTDLRTRGELFEKTLKSLYPHMEFVGAYNYDNTPSGAVTAVSTVLTRYPDLVGLFFGDGGAPGPAATAVHSQTPQVTLVLADTGLPSVQAVQAGQAYAAIGQSTFDTTFYCAAALYLWNTGLRVPDTMYVAETTITRSSASEFLKNPYRHPAGAVSA